MTVAVNGYNGAITVGGVDGVNISGGATAAGGDGSNPLALSTVKGGESEVSSFAIRLNGDFDPISLKINESSNNGADYDFSFKNGYNGSTIFDTYKVFNNFVTVKDLGTYCPGTMCITKKNGTFSVIGYKITTGNSSNLSPVNWSVTDGVSMTIDMQPSITNWSSMECKTFMFSKKYTGNQLEFKISDNYSLSRIELIVAGEDLPPTTKVTVSAEGANSADWAFARLTDGDNVIKGAVLTSSPSDTFCTTAFAKVKPSTDNNINYSDLMSALTDGKRDEEALRFGNGRFITFTFPKATPLKEIIIPAFYSSNFVAYADGVELLPRSPGQRDWVIDMSSIPACTVLKILANSENSCTILYEIIATEGEKIGEFTGYGMPLIIDAPLTDKNMIVYAKCKSTASDVIGNDTTTKIKIVAE